MSRIVQFIPYFVALGTALFGVIIVFLMNIANTDSRLTYIIPYNLELGLIALIIVGLSMLLKRKIWVYLFLIAIIASFFPQITFFTSTQYFCIASLCIDLFTLLLLFFHLVLNADAFVLSDARELAESTEEKVLYFTKRFKTRATRDLQTMNKEELVPEAKEAIRRILSERHENNE